MYQCNCGELFNNPEERTAHTASCPVMADKTMKQDWGGDSGQIAYEAGIEKGRQTERKMNIEENNMGNMNGKQAEEFFNNVKGELNLGLGFGLTTAGSICLGDRILIDERDLHYPWFTKQMILHEIAHHLIPQDNAHGTRFHKKYAALVNRFLAGGK